MGLLNMVFCLMPVLVVTHWESCCLWRRLLFSFVIVNNTNVDFYYYFNPNHDIHLNLTEYLRCLNLTELQLKTENIPWNTWKQYLIHIYIFCFFFFVMVKCGKWKAVHFVQHYIEVKGKTHMQDTDTGRPHNSRVRDPFIQEDFLCRVFLYTVSPWLPKGFPAEHFSLNHQADYHFHCTKMWGRIRITEARAEKVTEGSPKNVACCKTVPLREWWFYCDIEYSGLFATFHHKQKYNIYFAAIKYHVCTDHTFSDTNTKQVWLDEDDLAQDTTAPLLSATGEKHNRAEGILFPPKSIRRPHILLL